ncbi:unnamed protein product [Boreogadus saida]
MHVSVSLSRIESRCWTSGASGSRWCVPRRGGRRQEAPSGSPWRGVMVQGCGRGCHVSISSLRRRLAFHRVRIGHSTSGKHLFYSAPPGHCSSELAYGWLRSGAYVHSTPGTPTAAGRSRRSTEVFEELSIPALQFFLPIRGCLAGSSLACSPFRPLALFFFDSLNLLHWSKDLGQTYASSGPLDGHRFQAPGTRVYLPSSSTTTTTSTSTTATPTMPPTDGLGERGKPG